MANDIQRHGTNSNGDSNLAVAAATGITKGAQHETAISAAAAQAQAVIQSRYIMAYQRPRDMDNVRVNLIKACARPRFAETAVYRKPVGKKKNERTGAWEQSYIEGPSIRFAEEAARALGNVDIQTPVLYDDFEKRIVGVRVTDLESNTSYSEDITVQKTVERRQLKEGQQSMGQRLNSYGDAVYLVEATDDEVMQKVSALKSKAIRNAILRVLPSDIREEAIEQAYATVANRDAVDPEAAKKRVVDAFAQVGVLPVELKKYLGHALETCSPAELGELRKVYTAIKEGEDSWASALADKLGASAPAQDSAPAADANKSRTQAARDAVRAKTQQGDAAAAGANPATGEVQREPGSDG